MASRSLADELASGLPMVAGWVSLPEPLVAEACVRAGFSALVVDMQHGLVDLASAFRMISAIACAGGSSMLRIPVGEYQTASRLLDAGADMVIAPMIETVADASAFAAFMKYPPDGRRSWGPTRAVQLSGGVAETYRREANRRTLAVAMIETEAALTALDDILALPGIDGVFVGPADLSVALSNGRALNIDAPENLAAIEHVAVRAKAAGKFSGIYGSSGAHAQRYFGYGFTFVTMMSDIGYITAGAKAAIESARSDAAGEPRDPGVKTY